ncbi:MAG: hypothetical protein IPM28_13880 [Chloracidobacterium sp.]|nr:hypothetical protein [Chloracidobacterium sp.]
MPNRAVTIGSWSPTIGAGLRPPKTRRFKAKLIWSDTAFYALFEAQQAEELIVSSRPDLTKKTMNLWDRDVVEIFLAPDLSAPRRYFEFEVSQRANGLMLRST